MAYRRTSLLIVLAFEALFGCSMARAADLDGFYGGSASEEVPEARVVFGSGWYIRGDIGAVQDYAVGIARDSQYTEGSAIRHTQDVGYNLSLGGGYKFTNAFRGDITADFHQPVTVAAYQQECVSTTNATCSVFGKFASYDALLNGYFDIGTWYHVTPYVGAGVGVAFGSVNSYLTNDPAGYYAAKELYHTFAFALMAGLSIDVFDHTKLDIGYRYLNNGTIENKSLYFNEIRAGIRYMIDD